MQSSQANEKPSRDSWSRYALTALMLVAGLFALNLAGLRGGPVPRHTESEMRSLFGGDGYVKAYYAQQYAGKLGAAPRGAPEKLLAEAYKQYQSALRVRRPTADAIRRAGIATYAAKGSGALEVLDTLDAPERIKHLPEPLARELKSEVAMWRNIYTGNLTPSRTVEYARRIRQLRLGPTQSLALWHLYTAAGRDDLAKRVMDQAGERALGSVIALGLLTLLIVVAGIAGLAFVILFLVRRRRLLAARQAEENQAAHPDVLFQGFISYMAVFWFLSLASLLAISPWLRSMPADRRLLYGALVMSLGSTLGDLAAFGMFYRLLRRSGKSLRAIGLAARESGINVLYGIAGYCAIIPLLLVALLVWSGLSRTVFKGIETPEHPMVQLFTSGDRLVVGLALAAASTMAPFFEEVFFRGALYRALRSRLAVPAAVLASAAAFAMMHPFPSGFLPILAIGSVFALLVEIRGSLIPSMVAHAIHNTVAFLLLYLLVT